MKKRFDLNHKTNKATVIDCLECENYYTGACDARDGGCGAYEPTRKITLDKDVKTIKTITKVILGIVSLLCLYVLFF